MNDAIKQVELVAMVFAAFVLGFLFAGAMADHLPRVEPRSEHVSSPDVPPVATTPPKGGGILKRLDVIEGRLETLERRLIGQESGSEAPQ